MRRPLSKAARDARQPLPPEVLARLFQPDDLDMDATVAAARRHMEGKP